MGTKSDRRIEAGKRWRPCTFHEQRWLSKEVSQLLPWGCTCSGCVRNHLGIKKEKKKKQPTKPRRLDFISRVCRWCSGPPSIISFEQSGTVVSGSCNSWAALVVAAATWCFPWIYERTSVLLPCSHSCVFFFFLLGRFCFLTRAFYPLCKSKLAQLEGVFYMDLIPQGWSREHLSKESAFLPYPPYFLWALCFSWTVSRCW